MYKLFYANIKNLPADISPLVELLPADLSEKIKRFKKKDDQLRSLLGMLLLKENCSDLNKIKNNSYGKPYMSDGVNFNLSHSGDYVILLVGENDVGCDIEKHREHDLEGLAHKILTPEEMNFFLKHKDIPNLFFKLWTLKESYMKCVGKGFQLSPRSFSFNLEDAAFMDKITKVTLHNTTETHFQECSFQQFTFIDGYTISTCINEKDVLIDKCQEISC